MSDNDIESAQESWKPVFERLRAHLSSGGVVVWPADGIGTGRASLRRRAPKTWEALCLLTRELFRHSGQDGELVIIACGGRDYANPRNVDAVLGRIYERHGIAELIEGGARGADTLCGGWADSNGIPRRTKKANWDEHPKRGGWLRNWAMAEMLAERRVQTGCRAAVVAFTGDKGTRMMISIAKEFGFKVIPAPELVLAQPPANALPMKGVSSSRIDDRPVRAIPSDAEDAPQLPLRF